MKYQYGVEYSTNGKKPDLPDDVMVEVSFNHACTDWYRGTVKDWRWLIGGIVHFRIVDERFKPKAETVSEFFEKDEPAVYGKPKAERLDNSWKRGAKVEFPTGFGVLIIPEQDVNGVVIVMDESGEYKRVSASAIKPLKSDREKFIDACIASISEFKSANQVFGELYDKGFRAPEDK